MRRKFIQAFFCSALSFVLLAGPAAARAPGEKAKEAEAKQADAERAAAKDWRHAPDEAIQRWREMRFGIFIHWGPGCLTGKELSWARKRGQVPAAEYDNLYKQFNPTKFDADEWADIAAGAGAKYLVFTAKHHDGFVNFDSKVTDYKITSAQSPFGRDIVSELAEACGKKEITFGVYYSQRDWHSPHFMTDTHHLLIKEIHAQLKELCTNYGKVGIVWFDAKGPFYPKHWDSKNLFKLIREHQPDVVINDRCGLAGDFKTVEYHVGPFNRRRPWETCMQLGTQWSFKPEDNIKPLKECVHALVRCAGGDGNFLLNVGPMPDGRIEPRQAERLREIGAWLEKHGQAIYGTRGGPFKPGKWGASTCKGDKIYLFVLARPEDGVLKLPQVGKDITGALALTGGPITVIQDDERITVKLAANDREEIAEVIELTVEGKAFDISPVDVETRAAGEPNFRNLGLKSNQSSRRGHGSAKHLIGPVCIYDIFVSDKTSSWSEEEKAEVRRRMRAAVDFLKGQSAKYEVSVKFVQDTVEVPGYTKNIPRNPFAGATWTEEVFRLASGQNGNALAKSLKRKHEVKHVVFMIHVNKASTSYNISYYANVHSLYAAERSVMFYRYGNNRPTAAASYAHEILHMFGAGELYFPFDKDERRKRIAGRIWPNEIMHIVDYDIGKLEIGEYTAYRIGWLEKLDPEYRAFEDRG
ncbi:MAG: alpha-L-fucosidase [Planctomycetota bacterium]|jgi:alpha-L-fucosidase